MALTNQRGHWNDNRGRFTTQTPGRRRRKPAGTLVSIADLRLLEQYWEERENRIDLDAIREVKAEISREGSVSWKTVRDA